MRSPFDETMGIEITEVTTDRAVVELPVTPSLLQPGGIVHGGVYCALVETAASIGAHAWLEGRGVVVGTSNQTDFLRAVRAGRLRAEASPLQRGQRLQLWEVDITNEGGRVAHGKLKVMNLPAPQQ